ncbi:MAG: hypothetical protein BECKG1743D_GA0114223_106806, partial [Candidatus Kentron sp. G]
MMLFMVAHPFDPLLFHHGKRDQTKKPALIRFLDKLSVNIFCAEVLLHFLRTPAFSRYEPFKSDRLLGSVDISPRNRPNWLILRSFFRIVTF